MEMEDVVTNEYFYNLNKNLELPHNEVIVKPEKLPNIKRIYGSNVIKALVAIAKTGDGNG